MKNIIIFVSCIFATFLFLKTAGFSKQDFVLLPKPYFKEDIEPVNQDFNIVCIDKDLNSRIKYSRINFEVSEYLGEAGYNIKMICDTNYKPIFAFYNSKKIEDIYTSYIFNFEQNLFRHPLTIQLGNNKYLISLNTSCDGNYSKNEKCQSKVYIKKDSIVQELFKLELDNDESSLSEHPVKILWAGDFDGDNKLDLLLQHRIAPTRDALILYSSAIADKNQLVKPIIKSSFNWE